MSQQVVCNECGGVIDQSVQYYTANVQSVQMVDGVLVSGGVATQLDFHAEHLPAPVSEAMPTTDTSA